MMQVKDICEKLRELFPPALAADWDNTGLLVGRPTAEVSRIMTCLTLTKASVAEAIKEKASLVVAHHPLPFRGVKQLTSAQTAGGLLLDLAENGVAVYSPHTSFDSAAQGINQQWAEGLELVNIQPILPGPRDCPELGTGRIGEFTHGGLPALVEMTKTLLKCDQVRVVPGKARKIKLVAMACGAAGDFLADAIKLGADAYLTGETNFHTCLEAEAQGIHLILTGHFASERFALVTLATQLNKLFPDVKCWASKKEANPWQVM